MSDIVQLLQTMKEEHERNTATIEALEQRRHEHGRVLADSLGQADATEEEVKQILEKTRQSAGSARQLSEVLEAERAEAAALDAEAARLELDLAASTADFETMQVQSTEASFGTLRSLSELRCAWRKRNRDGYSLMVGRACALSALEAEVEPDSGASQARAVQA